MTRVEAIRIRVLELMRRAPFHPFALNMENGDRIIIEHPENIAFDPEAKPGKNGAEDFSVVSKKLRLFSSFAAVTSVALLDRGE